MQWHKTEPANTHRPRPLLLNPINTAEQAKECGALQSKTEKKGKKGKWDQMKVLTEAVKAETAVAE